ncbi:MAG: hypothetical protein IJX39_07865, partial [Clostridia bacterium]|nr:hypothetical protein [Clostridia bacterium]
EHPAWGALSFWRRHPFESAPQAVGVAESGSVTSLEDRQARLSGAERGIFAQSANEGWRFTRIRTIEKPEIFSGFLRFSPFSGTLYAKCGFS